MGPPGRRVRSARSARVTRVLAVLTGSLAIVAVVAAGTPGGASENPASVPEAAEAAEPGPSASPSAATVPLAAPASDAATTPAPTPRKVDPYVAARTAATKVTDQAEGWASYTLIDRSTGKRIGDSRWGQLTFTESTVKVWLAADLLATRARAGTAPTAYESMRMAAMIRESDDDAAAVIWRWLGADASIADMITTCRLQDTKVYPDWWSKTEISARDLARLGDCIAPGKGKLLSPTVGAPLLALMRSVDPSNAFGIQQVYPAGPGVRVAVKNGWTEHGTSTGTVWNVNCLGLWGKDNRWVLAVATRYPVGNGLDYGAAVCRQVTRAVLPLTRAG